MFQGDLFHLRNEFGIPPIIDRGSVVQAKLPRLHFEIIGCVLFLEFESFDLTVHLPEIVFIYFDVELLFDALFMLFLGSAVSSWSSKPISEKYRRRMGFQVELRYAIN